LCNRGERAVSYSRSTVCGTSWAKNESRSPIPTDQKPCAALCDSVKTLLMRAAIAGATVLIAASLCFAQESKTYSASEAARHVGETATLADKVANVFESKAGNIFLNFGARYPNQVFTAFIPKDSADQFPNAKELDGRTVSITGKIVLYKGKPEIVLDDPSMLKSK
jgi:hypothetical protein